MNDVCRWSRRGFRHRPVVIPLINHAPLRFFPPSRYVTIVSDRWALRRGVGGKARVEDVYVDFFNSCGTGIWVFVALAREMRILILKRDD